MFRSLALSLLLGFRAGMGGCADRPFVAPVTAALSDGFRLPSGPYGPGNRGLEYATAPGRPVRAVGAGEVVFAGLIAGERYVSVRHRDGLVSSYSYLQTITVRTGQRLGAGDLLGTTGTRFQLGVRRDGVYIDPAPLLGSPLRPRLVPEDFPATAAC